MEKGEEQIQCPQCFTLNTEDSRFCSRCGSSLSELFETLTYGESGRVEDEKAGRFTAGQMFDDRYRIVEEIGRGGMGRVFKAEDTVLGITVALKVIRPSLSKDSRFIDRFKQEMLLARSLSHESVIRIHDLGDAHGTMYISMEYIKGQSLKDFLHSSGTLSMATVTHIARQVAEALKVAHGKDIVHQDLKPSNIVIDQSGRAYILDFGLAKAVRAMAAEREGEKAGTPQYMSPEQATGGRVGPASDIYSFGAVLYEMVAGKPAFEADTPAEYKKKHATEKPTPLGRVNPHVPRPLERLILRCLEKAPEKRYRSMAEVLADLGRAESPPAWPSVWQWLQKNWTYVASAALLAGIAAAVYFLFFKHAPPPPPERRITLAVVYLTNNTGDKNLDYIRNSLPELLIADLLQSQYVRVTTMDRIYGILKSLRLLETPAYSTEDLKKVAEQAKADYILQGSFTRTGAVFRVTSVLYRVQGMEPLKPLVEAGSENDFWDMAESLSRKIKEGLNLSARAIAGEVHKDLRTITTASAEAFKDYAEGKRLFNEQKFEESIAALEKAVSLDPAFAMAYRLMALDYSYLRNGELYEKCLGKARSLLRRVSQREFYMIQALAAPSVEESAAIYRKLLAVYPDDTEALGELGGVYRNLERWDLAAEQYEKVLTIDPGDELAHENLAIIYMARGDYQKAIDLLRARLADFAGYFSFHDRLAMAYLCLHQYDLALGETRAARSADATDFEPVELEGIIHSVKGDPASAEACFREMVERDDPLFQITGRTWLCRLYLAQGRFALFREEIKAGLRHARMVGLLSDHRSMEIYAMSLLTAHERLQANDLPAALDASDQAVKVADETGRTDFIAFSRHLRGIVMARMGKSDDAAAAARELKAFIEKYGVLNDLKLYHRLRGEIAREKGDLAEAVASLNSAVAILPRENQKIDMHILFYDSLASVLLEARDWDGALKACETIAALTIGRARWGDLYAKNYLRLGKIHQARGERGLAAASFRRFLEVWSQADPGRPEIGEALKELEALGR